MFKEEELIDFLIEKPGYIKKGPKVLRKIIKRRGFKVSEKVCRRALTEVKNRLRNKPTLTKEPKILFYDIEVSFGIHAVWRPGYKLNVSYDSMIQRPKIICISYKWNNRDEVHTLRWDSNQDDKILLMNFIPIINQADFIVAHNGDNFDLPWVKARALAHGLKMYPKYPSVDTYKVAKRSFRLPNNKLDSIADYFGLGRKIKVDFQLWKDIVLDKSEEALQEMIDYCEQDVIVLEKVYNKLISFELPKVHNGVLQGTSKLSSPYSGGTNIELVKTTTTKAGTIKHTMLCKDTDRYFEMSNSVYKKFKEINS